MAEAREIPEKVGEFVELAKTYVREQTVEPAKRLGRLAAFSFIGALAFVVAALLLTVAGARLIVDALPDGAIWSGFGYVLAAIGAFVVTGIVMWRAAK